MKKILLALASIATHLGFFAQMETAKIYAETIQEQDLKELLYVYALIISKEEKQEPWVKKEP